MTTPTPPFLQKSSSKPGSLASCSWKAASMKITEAYVRNNVTFHTFFLAFFLGSSLYCCAHHIVHLQDNPRQPWEYSVSM